MELVRYRPGEAIRWLQTGAEKGRKTAQQKTRSLTLPSDVTGLGRNAKTVAGAIFDMGKSAWTDLLHHQASASEYVLHDDEFEIIRSNGTRRIRYGDVEAMTQKGDRTVLTLPGGSLSIRPYAHIVAGRVKVP